MVGRGEEESPDWLWRWRWAGEAEGPEEGASIERRGWQEYNIGVKF